jgi:hypothetical protein
MAKKETSTMAPAVMRTIERLIGKAAYANGLPPEVIIENLRVFERKDISLQMLSNIIGREGKGIFRRKAKGNNDILLKADVTIEDLKEFRETIEKEAGARRPLRQSREIGELNGYHGRGKEKR